MSNDPSFPNLPQEQYQQLGYSTGTRGKPGILTAVGIISILIGLIGALSSLSSVAQAVMFGVIFPRSGMTFPAVPPPAPVPATVPTTPAPVPSPATAPSPSSASPSSAAPATLTESVSAVNYAPDVAVAGAVVVWGNSPPTTAPAGTTTVTTTGAPTTAPITFAMQIDRVTMVTMLADGIIGFALAVFLFVLGIMTLTGSARARRGHLLWAWLKLPTIALSFISTMTFSNAMFQTVTATMTASGARTPAGFASMMGIIQATMYAVFALIYPIAILIVMRTKRVREYYDAGAGRGVG